VYPASGVQVRRGYIKDSFYGDEGKLTKGGRIVATCGCFWRHDRRCIPNDPVLKDKLLLEIHDCGFAGHRCYANLVAKALYRFW
jgi:G:T-mismatch repair DNA endonuclease (very short patch repair protein)